MTPYNLQIVRGYRIAMPVLFSLIALASHAQPGSKQQSRDSAVRISLKRLVDSAKKVRKAIHLDFHSIDSNTIVEVFPNRPFDSTLAGITAGYGFNLNNYDNDAFVKAPANPPADKGYTFIIIVCDTFQHRLSRATVKVIRGRTYMTNDSGIVRISSTKPQIAVEVTYAGMLTEKWIISAPGQVSIPMEADNNALRPAIVTQHSYFAATRPTVTGDRPALYGKPLVSGTPATVQTVLDGQIVGVYNTPQNGIPGSSSITTVRGVNSLLNNFGPAYIFNNVPLCTGNISLNNIQSSALSLSPLSLFPLLDVDTIEVLKDADATAIYGSHGANGVILYRLFHLPRAPHLQIDVRYAWGCVTASRLPKMLTMTQYDGMRWEAFKNDTITPDARSAPDLLVLDSTRTVNWQKMLVGGKGQTANLQIGLAAGNKTTRWSLGMGRSAETNVFPQHPANDLFNLRGALQYNSPGNQWDILNSAIYTRNWNHQFVTDPTRYQTMVRDAPAPRDPQGNLVWQYKDLKLDNPLAYTFQPYLATSALLLGDTYITYTARPSLVFKFNLGYNQVTTNEQGRRPPYTQGPFSPPADTINSASARYTGSIFEPQVEYRCQENNFGFNLLGGLSYQQQTAANKVAGDTIQPLRSIYEAAFARFTANYDSLYILDLTGRVDGTSRLNPHETFGGFGAVGAAWNFSKEKFSARLKTLNFGKIRFSYGTTGNDQIGDHQVLPSSPTASVNPFQYIPGYYSPMQVASGHLHWEVIRKMEIALDGGLWQDQLIFTISWYRNTSRNQLLPDTDLPTTKNITFRNYPAKLMNRGWEFTVAWKNIDKRHLQWTTSANFSLPATKLLAFNDLSRLAIYKNEFIVGQSPYAILDFRSKGVDPLSGVFQFEHQPNESYPSSSDKKIAGTFGVAGFGGITNMIVCNAWEFLFLVDGRLARGFDYQGAFYRQNPPGSFKTTYYTNETVDILDHWQNKGDHSRYQKLTTVPGSDAGKAISSYIGSSGLIRNTSLVRLRKVSVSYELPRACLQKLHVRQMQLFFNAENLWIFTPYKGVDPLIQNIAVFPTMRSVETGLHVGL